MAKFRVVQEPGVFIQELGFFRAGSDIELPDHITPSRELVPLDGAAKTRLKKVKQEYVDKLQEDRRVAMNDAHYTLPEREKRQLLSINEEPDAPGGEMRGNTPSPKGADRDPPDLPPGKEAQKQVQAEETGGKNLPTANPGKRAADKQG